MKFQTVVTTLQTLGRAKQGTLCRRAKGCAKQGTGIRNSACLQSTGCFAHPEATFLRGWELRIPQGTQPVLGAKIARNPCEFHVPRKDCCARANSPLRNWQAQTLVCNPCVRSKGWNWCLRAKEPRPFAQCENSTDCKTRVAVQSAKEARKPIGLGMNSHASSALQATLGTQFVPRKQGIP